MMSSGWGRSEEIDQTGAELTGLNSNSINQSLQSLNRKALSKLEVDELQQLSLLRCFSVHHNCKDWPLLCPAAQINLASFLGSVSFRINARVYCVCKSQEIIKYFFLLMFNEVLTCMCIILSIVVHCMHTADVPNKTDSEHIYIYILSKPLLCL